MKSNIENPNASEREFSVVKIAAVLSGLLSAVSVTGFLNSSPLTWRIPPETPSDYGDILLVSLTLAVFGISAWQLGWLLLALLAKKSNSSTLRIIIHKCGTKGARALLSSSLVLTGFSGTAMAATHQDLHASVTSMTSQTYCRSETPTSFPKQQTADKTHSLVKAETRSDFTWGASAETPPSSPVNSSSQTISAQTYKVLRGDNLWKIARNMLSLQSSKHSRREIQKYVIKLYSLNKTVIGSDPNLIYPGTILNLPTTDHSVTQPQSLEGTK